MRTLKYSEAINEALYQVMQAHPNVLMLGPGVNSPWYMGNTTKALFDNYGPLRVIDTPISESCVTGVGLGAALGGYRPIVAHARMDFMYYAFDQICNQIANYTYMFGGNVSVPLTIRGIINRGGEQAAQHSQALQSMFMHIPGLKVVMPGTPYDAKGMLVSAVLENNPVIYIDDRWLYDMEGEVPEDLYEVSLDKANIVRNGSDLTLVSYSYMLAEAVKATEALATRNINVELVDLRSISPIDKKTLMESVSKTGRLVIADGTWKTGGVSSEIAAITATECFGELKAPVGRVTLPDAPAPSSRVLEEIYYPTFKNIIAEAERILSL